jgi:hypothetical protein
MTPAERARAEDIYRRIIRPVHDGLKREFGIPWTPEADALSIAAMWQESKFLTRDQGDDNVLGPATGWGQFERMGGVAEVLTARQTKDIAEALCARVGVSAQPEPVWRIFASAAGDELHVAFVRLLIWKDPAALPPATSAGQEAAYAYYDRNWRPGRKRPQDWPASWAAGISVAGGGASAPAAPAPAPAPAQPAPPGSLAALEARVATLERKLALIADAAG